MDQKVIFGRTIGYCDSYLEFLFRHFKVFRLHTMLHDAARAVRAHSVKSSVCCYKIGLFLFALSCDCTTLLLLGKTLFAFNFQIFRLLKQYALHCFRYCTDRYIPFEGVGSFCCWRNSGKLISSSETTSQELPNNQAEQNPTYHKLIRLRRK